MNASNRPPSATAFGSATTRRRFVSSAAAVPLALAGTQASSIAQATPHATPAATPLTGEGQSLLAVADPANQHLYVYSLPGLILAGEVHGIVVQTHAGFLPLPNGELLFVDEFGSRLVSVGLVDGTPQLLHEAPVTGTVSHIAVDSGHGQHVAVGSDDPASPIMLVDLDTWAIHPVAIPDTGEVGLLMTHDTVFHRNDVLNRIEAYRIEDLRAEEIDPVSTVEIGAGGHGESIDPVNNRLYCATEDGIDVAAWDGSTLAYVTTYPWSDDGSIEGRGYFQRLTPDGNHVISYISDRSAAETEWTTWTNHAMVVDTRNGEVLRPEIGDGYVYRFGLAEDLALFYRIGAEGDEAVVLDLDPVSAAFGEIAWRIPLEPMSAGAQPADPIFEIGQFRAVNVTPDGSLGFITQGGDGMVTVVDPRAGKVIDTIEMPSSLDGGGYLAVFGNRDSFTDPIAR